MLQGNIDIGIWFTFGQVNMYYRSEYPVKDNPNTLGDPSFWTIKTAKYFYFNEAHFFNIEILPFCEDF